MGCVKRCYKGCCTEESRTICCFAFLQLLIIVGYITANTLLLVIPNGMDHAGLICLFLFTAIMFEMGLLLGWEKVHQIGGPEATSLNTGRLAPTEMAGRGRTIEKCDICQLNLEPKNKIHLGNCIHKYHANCFDSWNDRKNKELDINTLECPDCDIPIRTYQVSRPSDTGMRSSVLPVYGKGGDEAIL